MQKKSLSSLKKTLDETGLEPSWRQPFAGYIRSLAKKGAVLIVLFGSRAKGQFSKDSDIDLLIVTPNAKGGVRERVLEFFCGSLPVQPFVLTPEELGERIEKLDFLVFEALEDGILLYSAMDMNPVHELMRASRERFKLERVKNGWRFDAEAAAAAGI